MKNDIVRARINHETKVEAAKILNEYGLTNSILISMLFKQIIRQGGVPWELKVPNEVTMKALEDSKNGIGHTPITLEELKKKYA